MTISESIGLLSNKPDKSNPYIDVRTIHPAPNSPYGHTQTNHHRVSIESHYGAVSQEAIPDMTLYNAKCEQNEKDEVEISYIINLSLVVNIVLFIGKCIAYYMSGSLSVAASVVDSFLDLMVQLIIYVSHSSKQITDKTQFPAGKSRFEPVGLILCSALMFIAGLQLIFSSVVNLYEGFTDGAPDSAIDLSTVVVILAVIAIKAVLWGYCSIKAHLSDTVETLAFDHRNDVLSNIVACLAIAVVRLDHRLWWCDAAGCVAISLYIAQNWYELAKEKVDELVGRTADSVFIADLTHFVNNYNSVMRLDVIRAYHFGVKYLVELEVILPADMTVREAHDLSLQLQHEIEQMDEVERAFVHVDYASRNVDEHDVDEMVKMRLHESASESDSPVQSDVKDAEEMI